MTRIKSGPNAAVIAIVVLCVLLCGAATTSLVASPNRPPRPASQAQMLADLLAAVRLVEAETMSRFVVGTKPPVAKDVIAILGRSISQMGDIAKNDAIWQNTPCPAGTVHCPDCGCASQFGTCGSLLARFPFKAPPALDAKLSSKDPFTDPVPMLAVTTAVRLLEADVLLRFNHMPSRSAVDDLIGVLTKTAGEIKGLP